MKFYNLFTYMTFGEWLREKRKDAGLNQPELARRVSVSVSYISALERGEPFGKYGRERKPSVEIVDKLARALGQDQDEARIKAGYAPENPIIKKPQTLEELMGILEEMGVEQINLFNEDAIRNAPPEELQRVLDAISIAVGLTLQRGAIKVDDPTRPPLRR